LHRAEPVLRRHRPLKHRRTGLVVLACNARQHPHLRAGKLAVGHGHAQHGGVALDVPAVLQPQRPEGLVGQAAVAVPLPLVAELGRALADELAVEIGILVHGAQSRKRGGRVRGLEADVSVALIKSNYCFFIELHN